MREILALLSGLVFGVGLLVSGMSNPAKVKGFLDLAGAWDPSLAFVMAGAIAIGVVAFALAAKRTESWSGDAMEIPSSKVIDGRLVLGGILFGIGWGIGGFCPGPAIVLAATGAPAACVFIAAMLVGMLAHDRWLAQWPSKSPAESA